MLHFNLCILLNLQAWFLFHSFNSGVDRVRFHYGHPDVFDRIFHITRGGISKASRGINLSEDIFAGKLLVYLFSHFCTCNLLFYIHLLFYSQLIIPLSWIIKQQTDISTILLCRFQFYSKTWECYTPWVHPGGEGTRCWSQPNLTIWSKGCLW